MTRTRPGSMRASLWLVVLVGFIACTGGASEVPVADQVDDEAAPEAASRRLAPPGGPHAVGTTVLHWVDDARPELGTEAADDPRQLVAQIWYPAADGSTGAGFPFFPDLEAYQQAFGVEAYPASLGDLRSHSLLDAPPAAGERFPVVVFFHGWNSRRSAYTGLLEDLASHGYAVVGVDQPFAGRVALADGRVTESRDDSFAGPEEMLAYYGDDFRTVVSELTALDTADSPLSGRLALDRIGVMGHSNGGISAAQASRIEPRVAAVVLLDSFGSDVEELYRLEVPLLLVRTGGAEAPSESYVSALAAVVYDLEIEGGDHLSATDWPQVEAESEAERGRAAAVAGMLRAATVDFLDGRLRGRSDELRAPEASGPARASLQVHSPSR